MQVSGVQGEGKTPELFSVSQIRDDSSSGKSTTPKGARFCPSLITWTVRVPSSRDAPSSS